MKKTLNFLLVLNIGGSVAMDNQPSKKHSLTNAPQSEKKRRKKNIPFRKLAYPTAFAHFIHNQPLPIQYFGGKKRKQNQQQTQTDVYEEIFDLRTKSPIANAPFYELIRDATEQQNKPYFLAAVLVEQEKKVTKKIKENGKEKEVQVTEKSLGRRYHDAAYLIEWLFRSDFFRKHNRDHPLTKQHILVPVHFFKIEKLHGPVEYFTSELDLRQSSDTAQFMSALLKSAMGKPQDLFHLAQSYHLALGTSQDFKKAKKYYQKYIEKGFVAGINGLGDLYLTQGNYAKAEEQYLIGAKKHSTYAQLNLIYLFIIGKSTRNTDETISRFFAAQGDMEEFEYYTHNYPNRWEAIKQAMQAIKIEVPNFDFDNEVYFLPVPDDESNSDTEEEEEENENNNPDDNGIEMESEVEIFVPDDESDTEEEDEEQPESPVVNEWQEIEEQLHTLVQMAEEMDNSTSALAS